MEIYTNCKPTICNRKDIMSEDGSFMTEDVIKTKCRCEQKSVCFEIIKLLKDGNRPEAEELLQK